MCLFCLSTKFPLYLIPEVFQICKSGGLSAKEISTQRAGQVSAMVEVKELWLYQPHVAGASQDVHSSGLISY